MGDLFLGDAIGNLLVEAGGGTDDCYSGVGIEGEQDTTCSNLYGN